MRSLLLQLEGRSREPIPDDLQSIKRRLKAWAAREGVAARVRTGGNYGNWVHLLWSQIPSAVLERLRAFAERWFAEKKRTYDKGTGGYPRQPLETYGDSGAMQLWSDDWKAFLDQEGA